MYVHMHCEKHREGTDGGKTGCREKIREATLVANALDYLF